MKIFKKILAFSLAAVLMVGVLKVDAYAVAGIEYGTDVYNTANPEKVNSGYKTEQLDIAHDWVFFSNCSSVSDVRGSKVHYIVNGEEFGFCTANGSRSDYGVYAALCGDSAFMTLDNPDLFWDSLVNESWHFLSDNEGADFTTVPYELYIYCGTMPSSGASCGAHEHHFEYQTISEPTLYSDGMAGDVCTICGFAKNTQPVSAYGYAINDYATKLVNESKSGQVIRIDLGEFNSFPKAFMEKVAAKSAQNVTFIFTYKWNHVKQEITIPAFSNVDTSLDWYGPATMQQLYGAN